MSKKISKFNTAMYIVIVASVGILIYLFIFGSISNPPQSNVTSNILAEPEINDSVLTTLALDKTVSDFGTLYNDTLVSTEFTITNTGIDTLRIHYINVDCDCTTFEISQKNVAPSDSAILYYAVDTREKIGKHTLVTTFAANTEKKFYKLTLKMNIKRNEQ